jgi:hypothetical protein
MMLAEEDVLMTPCVERVRVHFYSPFEINVKTPSAANTIAVITRIALTCSRRENPPGMAGPLKKGEGAHG